MVVEGKDFLLICRERRDRRQTKPCTDELAHDWQELEAVSTVSADDDQSLQAWKVINDPVFIVTFAVKAHSSVYDRCFCQVRKDGRQFLEHLRELVGWDVGFCVGGHQGEVQSIMFSLVCLLA